MDKTPNYHELNKGLANSASSEAESVNLTPRDGNQPLDMAVETGKTTEGSLLSLWERGQKQRAKIVLWSIAWTVLFSVICVYLWKEHGLIAAGLTVCFFLTLGIIIINPSLADENRKEKMGDFAAFLHAVQVTLALSLALMACFDSSEPARYLTSDWLAQLRDHVPKSTRTSKDPVVVIDMSEVNFAPKSNSSDPEIDLTELQKFLDIVKNSSIPPRCIGIDLNFRGENNGSAHDPVQEKKFLQKCFDLGTIGTIAHGRATSVLVPITVGSAHGFTEDKNNWLQDPGYASIASAMEIPRDGVARMYARFKDKTEISRQDSHIVEQAKLADAPHKDQLRSDDTISSVDTKPGMRSMGQWVADAYNLRAIPDLDAWKTPHYGCWGSLYSEEELPTNSTGPDHSNTDYVEVESAFVDFRYLKDPETVKPLSYYVQAPANMIDLENKIVLIGDVKRVNISDAFSISGNPKTYSGVLLHACFASTLATQPIYEFNFLPRLAFDLLIWYGTLAALHWIASRRPDAQIKAGMLAVINLIAILLPVLVSWGMATLYNILWPEAVLITFALFIHPILHRGIVTLRQLWFSINIWEPPTHPSSSNDH